MLLLEWNDDTDSVAGERKPAAVDSGDAGDDDDDGDNGNIQSSAVHIASDGAVYDQLVTIGTLAPFAGISMSFESTNS